MKQYYVYILECCNGAYYAGYTTDMPRRWSEHQQGLAKCKYTRSFPPKKLAACWQIEADLSTVLKIEAYIKRRNKPNKLALTLEPEQLIQKFSHVCITDFSANLSSLSSDGCDR